MGFHDLIVRLSDGIEILESIIAVLLEWCMAWEFLNHTFYHSS
jgi:hypothetical protein